METALLVKRNEPDDFLKFNTVPDGIVCVNVLTVNVTPVPVDTVCSAVIVTMSLPVI